MSRHRDVWQEHHGALPPGYVVHHVNGDHDDNRIENLQALTPAAHKRVHVVLHRKQYGWDNARAPQAIMRDVNERQLSLSDVADKMGMPRPTLERWLNECGYEYKVQRRFVPIEPVPVLAAGGSK